MTESPVFENVIPGAPHPLTDFIGRSDERAEVTSLLRAQRLTTLIGPGGAGKTRLALAVSGDLGGRRHWVPLAHLESGELVAPTVARALGLSDANTVLSTEEIAEAIGAEETLLVLDNCEHVADAVALLVENLLVRCPRLTLLATSRTRLRIHGEQLWPIPPLGSAGDEHASAPYPTDAVALFVERAQAVRRDYDPDQADIAKILSICGRLDGNPLAIELCAARTQMLSVDQIIAALEDSLYLLVGSSRSAPVRQRTLRATLDWSHQLLSLDEAALFRRLAVFCAGATLDAVVGVAAVGQDPGRTLDLLSGLADHSLLRVVLGPGLARYELPDSVRQYAAQKLDASGEVRECRRRHLSWFLGESAAVDAMTAGAAKSGAFAELERELPDLRTAFAWCRLSGDVQHQLELARSLAGFAIEHGHRRECRGWLDAAISLVDPATLPDPLLWPQSLHESGVLAFLQCDYEAARDRLESARSAFHALQDDQGAAAAVQALSGVLREQGDYRQADDLAQRSLTYWQSIRDRSATVGAIARLAFSALLQGDDQRASTLARDTLVTARQLGDPGVVADALIILGGASLVSGELAAAGEYFEEAHRVGSTDQLEEAVAYADEGLGLIALTRGDVSVAAARLRASLRRQHELGDHWRTSSLLVELATCRRLRGEPRAAAQLLGASEALLEQIGGQLPPVERAERERTVALIAAALSEDDLNAGWTSGRSVSVAAAVATAMTGWEPAVDEAARARPGCGTRLEHGPRRRPGPPEQVVRELTLQTLGREEVQLGGRILSPADFTYAKPRELLCYLADQGAATKAQIGLALWPDATATELRSAFHTTLHHLRRAVGADRIRFEHGGYRLDEVAFDYDVDGFTQALAGAKLASNRTEELKRLRHATQLYLGDFLPSSSPAWSRATRDTLRERYERALMATGRILVSGGGHLPAIDVYRQVLASNPHLEAAHRELMRCYDAAGEPARAVRHYDTLAVLLREELRTAPAERTTQLYERIRTRQAV